MKNIIFSILIILSAHSYAQRKDLGGIVSVQLPKNATQIKHEAVIISSDENGIKTLEQPNKFIFKVDGMTLSLNVFYAKESKTTLDFIDLKKGLDYNGLGLPNYRSEFKIVNSNNALISSNELNGIGSIFFYMDNKSKSNRLFGRIEFSSSKYKEAKQIVDNLIADAKFPIQ